jgi:hypothetical protein
MVWQEAVLPMSCSIVLEITARRIPRRLPKDFVADGGAVIVRLHRVVNPYKY